MYRSIVAIILCCLSASVCYPAEPVASVTSPDVKLTVTVSLDEGMPLYSVQYDGKIMIADSPLGLITNEGDFSREMEFTGHTTGSVEKKYEQGKIKRSSAMYRANTLSCVFRNGDGKEISVTFQVSNNDIAFRYEFPAWGDRMACVVESEASGYRFPSGTTSFLSPMMGPMGAFARTSPSYESGYEPDATPETNRARYGYVFPGLFRIGGDGWVLLSETGVRSLYCASHLSPWGEGGYTVAYPDMGENNGFGSTGAQLGLPGVTPWRTITVGSDLKPIVETTIPFDVVEPLYEPSQAYKYGKGTWSWIIWQDDSMNYDDQVKYIDLASDLGFEYILIDAFWDTRIGYERMEDLIGYANSKGVDVFLWYNSNGSFNDAPQGPRNRMNTSIERKREMEWLKRAGVKGLKVDFFGGDKQETMRLYEDILSDANDYGLMIIFHGCTLPRGWEVMYPNYVGSEAVLASEMLVFSQHARENEAFYACLHPFIRNTVGSMEFGGVVLNKYFNRGNSRGQERLTTDAFQLATSVLFQNPVQMFAITPNNPGEVAPFVTDFLREVPTTWDETVFIDGYPGLYCVIARRHGDRWYVTGANARDTELTLTLDLPMQGAGEGALYVDDNESAIEFKTINTRNNAGITVTMQPRGGFVLTL